MKGPVKPDYTEAELRLHEEHARVEKRYRELSKLKRQAYWRAVQRAKRKAKHKLYGTGKRKNGRLTSPFPVLSDDYD